MRELNTPWKDELVPDHTTISRHLSTILEEWLNMILAETARRCMEAAGGVIGPLGAGSSGVTTTRYEEPEGSDSETKSRRRKHWKYHITSVLGLQIILAAFCTPGNVHDSKMLLPMLDKIKSLGFDFSGRIFNADGGYDAECIFEHIFWMGMLPNIKQRKGATNHDKPNRKKAAERFNSAEYERKLLIEGVFGAEETRRYQLHCRFVRDKNQIRFAKRRAIAWNIRVLNRLECANQLHIPIIPYGGITHTECA